MTGCVPDPSHFHANLQRGSLLLNQNRPREALPFLQAAIAANPDAPQGYAELARCWNAIPGERHKSISAINRAIGLAPNSSFYLGCKAWYLVCLLRFHSALNVAQEGIALNPTCPQSLNSLANAYTKLNRWKKAEETCRRILALDPNDVPGLNLLAQALRHQGRWKETRQVVAHLLANTPNNAFGQANAGYAALAAGDHLRANEHFLSSLRMDPHFDLARRGLLQSLRARIWITRFNMRLVGFLNRCTASMPSIVTYLCISLVAFSLFIFGCVLDYLQIHGERNLSQTLGLITCSVLVGFFIYIYFSGLIFVAGNFFLMFDRLGQHALTTREKIRATLPIVALGMMEALMLACGAWQFALGFAAFFGVLAFPIQFPPPRDRLLRPRLETAEA